MLWVAVGGARIGSRGLLRDWEVCPCCSSIIIISHSCIIDIDYMYVCVGYDDKENAEEAIFFKKEDEKLLKELLTKVRAQAEKHDVHSAKGVLAAEKSALEEIVGAKLSDAEKDGLMQWKHTHFWLLFLDVKSNRIKSKVIHSSIDIPRRIAFAFVAELLPVYIY